LYVRDVVIEITRIGRKSSHDNLTHSLFVVMSGPHVGLILNEFALLW